MDEELTRTEKLKDDILNGPIIKTLLILGWPVMISNVLQMFYNLVDTFWLGKVGKIAVAAPTVGFPVVFLMMSLGIGFSIAGISLVSQHTGAGSHEHANEAAGQVVAFMVVLSLVLAALGYLIAPGMLGTFMNVPDEVFPGALNYIRIIFIGTPFMFMILAFRPLIRGVGDTITPMLVTGTSVLINLIIDPLLIMGWGFFPALGVEGAAIATVISRGIAALMAIYLLFSNRLKINLDLKDLRLSWDWVKRIVKIGAPSSIGMIGTAVGSIVLVRFVSRLGVVVVSAYGIGQRIIRVLNVVIWGLASPLTTMIGQNLGAENKERAAVISHRAFGLAFISLSVLAAVAFVFRFALFRVFINDPEVVKAGAKFLGIFVWSIPMLGIFRLVSSVFRGSGHTKPSMTLSLIRLIPLRIGLAYLFAFGVFAMGAMGLWWGLFASNVLGALLSLGWYLTGSWKKKII